MNPRINKYNYLNTFIFSLIFFSIQWTSSYIYFIEQNHQDKILNKNQYNLLSPKQLSYADNLEIDSTIDLQTRKMSNDEFNENSYISSILIPSSKNKINIISNIYFENYSLNISNPRAPPFFS
jgi:hypothetical protein